jgi:amino acid transporter
VSQSLILAVPPLTLFSTELVGLAATETPNPRKTLPSAVKNTFWRITLIYITSLTIIGLAIPYTNERLGVGSGANASPFVIVMDLAGIKGMNHLINITICISVLSIGLSCVYAGSRTLTALAETGYAPKMFTYIDKSGRPLYSLIAILVFSPLAYINVADVGSQVFDWLVALSGLSTLFTWLSILVTHIRFRRAWKVQGHDVGELPFTALGGIYGSYLGAFLIVIVLIAQFYIGLFPIRGDDAPPLTGTARAESFFLSYIAFPILIAFYIGGYFW